MNDKLARLFQQLIPYLMLGIIIACTIGLFILFYYIVLWGLVIGFFIWLITTIKRYFFSKHVDKSSTGRVIDQTKDD
jgi:hypothetical protein